MDAKKKVFDLKDTIKEDCKTWESLRNQDRLLHDFMYLNECENSAASGLYQLILNGAELWYGSLQEINAVVKSMIYQIDRKDWYWPE